MSVSQRQMCAAWQAGRQLVQLQQALWQLVMQPTCCMC